MNDVTNMIEIVRSALGERDTVILPDAAIVAALNDGSRDVSVMGLCIEKEITVIVRAGTRIIPFAGLRVESVELVSYFSAAGGYVFADLAGETEWEATAAYLWNEDAAIESGSGENMALLPIHPVCLGRIPAAGAWPQYFFQWGQDLIIEPVPAADLLLKIFVADLPAETMFPGGQAPGDIPVEFLPSVMEFALAEICIKLRRWRSAAAIYGRYLANLARRRRQYLIRKAEEREWLALAA